MSQATQGQQLLQACRRRAMTYGELLDLHISTSPWRRLAESERRLLPGEKLVKSRNARGLVTFRVVKGQ